MSKQYPGGIISKTAPTPSGPYANDTAPGVWTLEQQAYWQKLGQWPTAGNVNPDAFIENLFSTYLYTGNGSTQTITNGIDLAGEGGLVWIKSRSAAADHHLTDTARGMQYTLHSNLTDAQYSTSRVSANSDGFSLTSTAAGEVNTSGRSYASWTFRKQPKFFDVVTYTGNGANRNISHSLGSAPGCIIIKCTSTTSQWVIWHRSGTQLNNYCAYFTTGGYIDQGTSTWGTNGGVPSMTSTTFSLGSDSEVNTSGATYVAYIYAHNAGGFGLTGTDNVISCGSYTGNGSTTNGPLINLGYEPQWLLIKNASDVYDWFLYDTMRGLTADLSTSTNPVLYPNLSVAQADFADIAINSTGFKIKNAAANPRINASGNTYIYIAIRRGPMKVPTSGTSVYYTDTSRSAVSGSTPSWVSGFVTDMAFGKIVGNVANMNIASRLTGTGQLFTNTTSVEGTDATYTWDFMQGWGSAGSASSTFASWMFRRAPSFFDEVCYTGTGSLRTVSHNLTAVPELLIVKRRDTVEDWNVYSATTGNAAYLRLNTTAAVGTAGADALWGSTTPTSSVFTVKTSGGTNASGGTYVAYLFATCAGVSKVGSYTGTGTTKQIDCGFTGGARFVLIKRTDSTGDWYVWDSARGIVSGNDPYLLLNSTAAEVTGTDYVDTYSAGFEISSTAPAAINASGGTFIFLAIA